MNIIGHIIETFSAKRGNKAKQRPVVDELIMIKNYGIKNDKFAGKNENSTVMIIGKKAYDIAKENNIELEFGSYGENILLDFNPHAYPIGTIITIEDVELEITQNCKLCNKLSVFDEKLPKLVLLHRGVYCKIVKSGIVRKNQTITL